MQNIENTEGFKKEQMVAIIKSCDLLEKNVNSIKRIAQNLQQSSEEILEHTTHGDLSNDERNRQLWHGLNNVEHQLKQFSRYTEASVQDFVSTSGKLIEELRTLRPNKDNLH